MDINTLLKQMTGAAEVQQLAAESTADYFRADTDKIVALQGTAESQAQQIAATTEQTGMDAAAVNYMVNVGRQKNAAVAGMNPDDQNNLYIQSLAKITEARTARDASRAEYDKLNSVGLLDNPIGYIMAQLQLPKVAEAHNRALAAEATARGDMRNTIADINAKDTLIAANTADTLRKVDEQKAKQAGLQAQMQLAKLQIDNISTVGQRAIQALQTQSIGYQAQKDIIGAQMDAQKFALQQESVRLQREQMYEIRQEQLKKKKMEADAEAEAAQRAQAAAAILGYSSVPNLKNLDIKSRQMFERVASSLQLGNDVYDSLQTIQTIGNKQVMAQTNGGLGEMVQGSSIAIRQAADAWKKLPDNKLKTLKPGEAEKMGAQMWQADAAASGTTYGADYPVNNPRWDTTFNPYKPKYLAVLDAAKAGAIPALKDNAVVSIMDTLPRDPSAGNLTGKQLETVVQTLAQRVANGTLGVDKAAKDLVALNQIGASMNREQLGYEVLGLPPQQRLILNVPGTAAFSDPQKLDGMDFASTKAAIAKMASQSNALKNLGTATSAFIPQRMGGAFDLIGIATQAATTPAPGK